jgi:hypothetical protein
MKQGIVADDFTIINTQGVRFAEKVDSTYGGPTTHCELRVTYKGDKLSFRYPDAATRDAQFARLRAAMESHQASDARLTDSETGTACGSATPTSSS